MPCRSHRSRRVHHRAAWPPLAAALAVIAAPPRTAMSQQGFDLSASVTLSESYDDNVFAVPKDRRQDVVSCLTPRLGLAYRSPRVSVLAQYARDAEAFSRNPELTTLRARQEATVDAQWSPGAGFELAGTASYAETQSPSELAVITDFEFAGLELRRSLAHRFSTTQSLSRRLGGRTTALAEHSFSEDEIVGGLASVTRVAGLRLMRQIGPVDTFDAAYAHRQFLAGGDGTRSHVLTLTWAREVTSRAHLQLKAGPRWSGGTLAPELAATLRHRFRRGDTTLAYVQTETSVIGHPSPVTAQGLSLRVTHALRRTLTVTAGPSVFQARGQALEATVYRLGLDVAWRLRRHLSVEGSHQLSLQYGELDGRPRGEIVHNTVLFRLVAGSID